MLALPRPLLRWLVCLAVALSFLGLPVEGKAQATGNRTALQKAGTDTPVSAKKKKKKKKKKHKKKVCQKGQSLVSTSNQGTKSGQQGTKAGKKGTKTRQQGSKAGQQSTSTNQQGTTKKHHKKKHHKKKCCADLLQGLPVWRC